MKRRESVNITLYGVPLTVYGDYFTDQDVFELDRVEAGDGTQDISSLLSESDVVTLNEAATASINWRERERLIYGDPDAWKHERAA